jgi:hypothetical protein
MALLSNRDAARSSIGANGCFMSFKRYVSNGIYMIAVPIELWMHLKRCVYDHHSD